MVTDNRAVDDAGFQPGAALLPLHRGVVTRRARPARRRLGRQRQHDDRQHSYEIFSPPYLFKGPRPAITSAPGSAGYGTQFTVATPDAANISHAVLIAPAAVTHNFDENGRYVPLNFTQTAGGLQLTAPANGNDAPPGPYMLFLVNSNGVPSIASWINVG